MNIQVIIHGTLLNALYTPVCAYFFHCISSKIWVKSDTTQSCICLSLPKLGTHFIYMKDSIYSHFLSRWMAGSCTVTVCIRDLIADAMAG